MKYPAYEKYKDTEVECLGRIPTTGWKKERLYDIAFIRTSNVDKKTVKGQRPVKLCNYTDVYYNEKIHSGLEFMMSSASEEEIKKFRLFKGDVVITKDSESPFDIGIGSYVDEDIDDLVCGYHLAIIKPNKSDLYGQYLYYAISSDMSAYQFTIAANGVTRFGLSYNGMKNIKILVPSINEQQKIADFLDHKTAQIDRLIEKKQVLVEMLNEKRMAMITLAVTKGLDENVPMKDSGVEWLGTVPAYWDVKKLKFSFNILNNRRIPLSAEERTGMQRNYPYYGASGIIDYVEDYIFDGPAVLVAEDGANLLSRSTPLAFIADGKYWVNNHAHILRPIEGPFDYWANLLCSINFEPFITGSAQPKLTKDRLASIPLPSPPLGEQKFISAFILEEVSKIDPMVTTANLVINKLQEYRTAIITAAVTGKIKVL
ncbi:MAG: hypothetical protein BBJ57_12965 [Desulfobacterales bacterium PC51MH44]|nr:MAG: hypothetical protein BBJ57_12965 [Desulfobacterales bacterium PC51MH44]